MPYYLYKISQPDEIGLVKNLDLVAKYEKFRDAKLKARSCRVGSEPESEIRYQIIFADSQLMAEEQLLEKREKPTLMEYEK